MGVILARNEYWNDWNQGKFSFHIEGKLFIQNTILESFFYNVEKNMKEWAEQKGEGIVEVIIGMNAEKKSIKLHLYKWGLDKNFRDAYKNSFPGQALAKFWR